MSSLTSESAWCRDRLSSALGFDVGEEMGVQISTMPSEELADHLEGLLGKQVATAFLADLRDARLYGFEPAKKKGAKKTAAASGAYVAPTQFSRADSYLVDTTKILDQAGNAAVASSSSSSSVAPPARPAAAPAAAAAAAVPAGRAAFVRAFTFSRAPQPLQPGQRVCKCLGALHPLLGACPVCGKPVCVEEGAGPCQFCGRAVVSEGSARSLPADAAQAVAQAHKDKLLDFDRSKAKRTVVLDDQADYFKSNSQWLSNEERAGALERERKALEKKYERKGLRITFDFAGRRVLEAEKDEDDVSYSLTAEEVREIDTKLAAAERAARSALARNPAVKTRPVFAQSEAFAEEVGLKKEDGPAAPARRRVQHDLADFNLRHPSHSRDTGACLSMHQPWAGLLVAGIKRVEGRTWPTDHRGRLWIASTAQAASPQDIAETVASYERQFKERGLEMPPPPVDYPSGVLLGCVTVVDCIPLAEFPQDLEESESPFCFICDNPAELVLPLKVSGQHKIWTLQADILKNAQAQLSHRW